MSSKILKYPPISGKFPRFLHGADYNPDQWKATPEVWDDDMRLMKIAHVNTMAVGIFSWAAWRRRKAALSLAGWMR